MPWTNAKPEPPIGSYGVVRTWGLFGILIRIGTQHSMNHAFIYIGDGKIVQAAPRKGVYVSEATDWPKAYYNRHEVLTDAQRASIVANALSLVGRKYNFQGIFVMFLGCLGLKTKWAAKRLERTARLFCSQDVDQAYYLSGVHLFDDGRLFGQISPGDLADRIMDL